MFKIDNAIILAAGRGSRMDDLTIDTPKPLLKINNKPMIETIIEHLSKLGLNEIHVVTGYLSESFNYLVNKYNNVSLHFNANWDKGNNVTSYHTALDFVKNTLVINGDVLINSDCISLEYETSCTYAEHNSNINEWLIKLDSDGNIIEFDKNPINQSGLYQREVTVINEELASYIRKEIAHYNTNEYFELLVLDTANKYKIPFRPYIVNKYDIYDIDFKDKYLDEINKH